MYEIIELYDTQPQTKKINMEFKNIRDLTPLIAILAKFRNLSEISFHGNKISSVPILDTLRNLRAIDFSNNPIKIDKHFLDRLHQSPRLQQLYIDCTRQEREAIIENVPNLKALNGQAIVRERYVRQTLEQELRGLQSKLSEEMKKMKEAYSKLASSLDPPDTPSSDMKSPRAIRDQQLHLIYRDIQEEMNYFYSGLQDRLSREGVFAYCKNKLTAVLDNLMVKILDENASEAVVRIYEQVSKIKGENFDYLLRIILNASYERHVNEEVQKPTNRLRKETIYQNEIFRLKKQIVELRQEQSKQQQISQKEHYLLEKKLKPALNKSPSNPRGFERSSSITKLPKRSPSAKTLTKTPALSRSPSVKATTRPSGFTRNQNAPSRMTANGSKPVAKILTLDQLLKLIEEIMAQKRKYNLRSLTKNETFETSQQFIFTFFTRKYGLKEVALQWSLSLIKAIEQYCRESIEVQIFGKILKNQLYEQYYDEYKQFGKEIEKVYKDSRIDRTSIQEGLFKKIFFYFFSYENDETFQKIVKTFTFPISHQSLTYFLQSYKLAFEQKHLAPFLQLFGKVDTDDDSALNAKQAKQLILAIIKLNKDLTEEAVTSKMEQYSAVVDTFRKNKFIFSQIFQLAHKLL